MAAGSSKSRAVGSIPTLSTGRRNDSDGDDNQKKTGIGKRIGPETIITRAEESRAPIGTYS